MLNTVKLKNWQVSKQLVKSHLIDRVEVVFQLWDTSGSEGIDSLGPTFFRTYDIVFLMFDITNNRSFEILGKNLQTILDASCVYQYNSQGTTIGVEKDTNAVFVLVELKCDLEANRKVSNKDINKFIRSHEKICYHIKCSALSNMNINESMKRLAKSAARGWKMANKLESVPFVYNEKVKPEGKFSNGNSCKLCVTMWVLRV